jgi:7-cyano-7-deazaguanine synthase
MSRALILLSGGIDSAVALALASRQQHEISAISFNYYLRPFREKLAVYRMLESYPARLIEVPVPFLREAADLKHKLPKEVPEGYISNRNLIFYSIASYFAEVHSCEIIVGGHNSGDQESFPDASAKFFSRLQSLTNEALLTQKIQIELPLREMTKLQVLKRAVEWGVPLENTWSCYWDRPEPCGQCESCRERTEAFQQLGLKDPLKANA